MSFQDPSRRRVYRSFHSRTARPEMTNHVIDIASFGRLK